MGTATTVAGLLDDATRRLSSTLDLTQRDARLEARVLAAHALQVDPAWLIAHDTDTLKPAQVAGFDALLMQRLAGIPVAYVVGAREFYGRRFQVTPDVLIPRPDTELLVECALQAMPPRRSLEVLDLGTGSGCIAITLALERPDARVTAIDQSAAALEVARRNARHLGASVVFQAGDWFSPLGGQQFDLIVSNPPYIAAHDPHLSRGDLRFEPVGALASGADGLDDLRAIVAASRSHLKPGGVCLLEHGWDQVGAVCSLFRQQGWHAPTSWPDLAGILRVSGGKLSE